MTFLIIIAAILWCVLVFRMIPSHNKGITTVCAVITLLLFTFLAMFPQVTKAEEYLYTGAWSYHVYDDKRHLKNETHYLLGYSNEDLIIATFKNSYNDQAYMAGAEFYEVEKWDISFKIYGGAVYGYYTCFGDKTHKNANIKLCPALIPEITYTKYKFNPSVLLLGKAITLAVKWDI